MRLTFVLLFSASLLAQAPPITGVGHDAVTARSARIHWTAGFYHDTASDTTLTTGFTTAGGNGATVTITVGSTAKMKGWADTPVGIHPTSLLIGGTDMARVQHVIDATHVLVDINTDPTFIGGVSFYENSYSSMSGMSLSVTGTNSSDGVATATLYYPPGPHWVKGHGIQFNFGTTIPNQAGPIISRVDSTHVTFAVTCSPGCNGTHDYTSDPDMRLNDWSISNHVAGETISFLSTDAVVCYGDPSGSPGVYPHSAPFLAPYSHADQATKHWVQLTGQTPGSRIHYIVLSTPNQFGSSDCSSIGPHTGKSADAYIDFAAATEQTTPTPPSGVSFSTALPAAYDTSSIVGGPDSNCSTLQACLNYYRNQPGNHEIRITAGTTLTGPVGGWILPPQTNGSQITTIRTTAPDESLPAPGACVPPLTPGTPSPCIDNLAYAASLATLQANGTSVSSVFRVGDLSAAHGIHIGPGLKLAANPQISVAAFGQPFINLAHSWGAGAFGHAYHSSNFIVDRVYFYQKNIQNGSYAGVFLIGGNSVAVVDCVMEGIANRAADVGGIFLQNSDEQDGGYVFTNNRFETAFDGVYLNGDGWNTGPGVIQRNWFHMRDSWNKNDRSYPKQVQLPVSSATSGSTTTIALAEPSEFGFTSSSYPDFVNTYVSFSGAVGSGTWDKLNAREFTALAGTLLDVNCASGRCTAQTSTAHGFAVNDRIWMGGLSAWPCVIENGIHQITAVTDATHLQWTSTTAAHCIAPDGGIMGPMFHPSHDNTTWTIAFDSTGFPALSGTVVARYGQFVVTKNLAECKTCVQWDISGNLFENSISFQQNAVGFALTNKAGAGLTDITNWGARTTISDISIHDNWFRRVGLGISIQGLHDYLQNITMNRVQIKNNLFSYSGNFQCTYGENCDLDAFQLSYGNNIVWDHNTAMNPGGIASQGLSPPPVFGNWTIKNSIFNFGSVGMGVSSAKHIHYGSQIYQTSGTCNAGPCAVPEAPFNESLFTWGRNALMGTQQDLGFGDDWLFNKQYYNGLTAGSVTDYQLNYWPHNLGGVGFAGLATITNVTSASPIVLTTSPLACVPDTGDRYWVGGVRGILAANGTWLVKNATTTSLTLAATAGTGTYTAGTGVAIPVTGKCNKVGNWALGTASPFRAGVSYTAPSRDLLTAGNGPSMDSADIGVDITALTQAMVGQGETQCLFTINPTSTNYPAEGDTRTITVTASGPVCAWNVANIPDWLRFSPASGIGTTPVTATALPNLHALRRAYPVIAGQTFSVTQDSRPVADIGIVLGSRVLRSSTVSLQ